MEDIPDQSRLFPLILGSSAVPFDHTSNSHAGLSKGWSSHGGVSDVPIQSEDGRGEISLNMLFDFHRYYGDNSDAAAQSDTLSEVTSETTPSTLTAATSVSTTNDIDEDIPMIDLPRPEPLFEIVWPKVSKNGPPRDPTMDHGDLTIPSEGPCASLNLNPSPVYPGSPAQRPNQQTSEYHDPSHRSRTRKLGKPEKTSKVRGMGACIPCKIARVSCDTEGACEKCRKECDKKWPGIDPEKLCTRRELYAVVGTLAKRWCGYDAGPFAGDGLRFDSRQAPITIHFSRDPRSPALRVIATCFSAAGIERWRIVPDGGLGRDQDIRKWVKDQTGLGLDRSFDSCIERFLTTFSEENALAYVLKLEGQKFGTPPSIVDALKSGLEKLVTTKLMFRVWRVKQFHIRSAATGALLSETPSGIHDYLHQYAGQAMSELERGVLKEIDKLASQTDIKADRPIVRSALNVATWAALWQLIFVYRDSLGDMYQQPQNPTFAKTTAELYNKVVVLYSWIFRTRKILEDLGDSGAKIFQDHPILKNAFEEAWKARGEFYASFRCAGPDDELVEALIIDKETKVLNRKRNTRK